MFKITCSVFILFALLACNEEPAEVAPPKWTKDQSTALHKELAAQEEIDIQLFVERQRGLSFQETGSGLRYAIVVDSIGELAHPGQRAIVDFKISLLDGTLCYESEKDYLHEFRIDKSEIESGIQETIKHMSLGDSAKAVFPSHLGHGLTGDMNKIPPLTPLVIDLSLKDLK